MMYCTTVYIPDFLCEAGEQWRLIVGCHMVVMSKAMGKIGTSILLNGVLRIACRSSQDSKCCLQSRIASSSALMELVGK